jgi:opacity protein-like surface antigen
MKNLVIGILALGFASIVFASGDMFVKPVNYFDGFYAGIGGGVTYTRADATAAGSGTFVHDETYNMGTIPTSEGVSTLPLSLDTSLSEFMVAGEAFVGFGKSFAIGNVGRNNFYLGLEIFGKLTPMDPDNSVSNTKNENINAIPPSGQAAVANSGTLDADLYNYCSFGGDLRFGYLITPKIMVYLLAGIDVAPFQYTVNYNGTASYDLYNLIDGNLYPESLSAGGSSRDTSWKTGFSPGIGVEAMLTNKLSLRAQFVYTYWGDGGFNSSSSYTSGNGGSKGEKPAYFEFADTYTSNVASGDANSIQRGILTVDLVYHFN